MPTAQMIPRFEEKIGLEQEWTTQPELRNAAQGWTKEKQSPAVWSLGGGRDLSIQQIHEKLQAEVDRTKILSLEDDWDGEGSGRYSEETVNRAIQFVKAQAKELLKVGLCIPIPRIGAGPDGSIDLHWKQSAWELLVNIPAAPGKMATFYGDDYKSQKIRGSVDPVTFNWGIAAWLMK